MVFLVLFLRVYNDACITLLATLDRKEKMVRIWVRRAQRSWAFFWLF